VDNEIINLLNRNNSLMTNAQEDSSIKAPIPNTFSSSSNYASSTVVAIVIVLGFNY
jgi:hypothetical protein